MRLGAVVACAACRHRYQIDQTHVARRVAPVAMLAPGEADPLLAGAVVPGAIPGSLPGAGAGGRRLNGAGNVVGLSGLSEAMQREAGPTPSGAEGVSAAPPVARLRRPGQETEPAVPEQPHPRSVRMIYLLAGVLCLVVAFLGVAIWYANA